MTIQRGPRSVVSVGVFVVSLLLVAATRLSAQITYAIFPASPQTRAQPANSTLHVTLEVQDSTVRYTVSALARQAYLHPIFTNSPVLTHRITVRVVDVTVMDAFAKVLQGTGLEAVLARNGEMVMIRERSNGVATIGEARAERGIIVGRVTDSASGQGLGGASVKVEWTKLSTVTSDSGNFSLRNVPPGDQLLRVRLFGYRPAERTVTVVDSAQTRVSFVMVPVPTVLSGVVTTATGLQRKVEVGNDITSLNVDSIMKVAPVTSVTDLLETRVPGLTVLHTSGVPGDPSRIRIRGASSITGNNDPIVVVDGVRVYASQSDPRNNNLAKSVSGGIGSNSQGVPNGYAVPSPLDQIDPSSIETVEVLKGPSATAIYGSDAANGVIVITTKHGHAGPTHWNLALGQGVNWLPGSWPTNYYRFGKESHGYNVELDSISAPCAWNDLNCVVDSLVPFQALNDPRYSVFSHGSDQTASLTVSGGVPTLQYSLTGSGAGDLGNLKLPAIEQQRYKQFYGPIPSYLVRPDNYTNWGVNGSLTAQPTPTMRVTLQSSLFNSTQQQSSLQQAIAQIESEYITQGVIKNAENDQIIVDSLSKTPLIQNDMERATSGSLTSTNVLTLNWQLFSWLPLNATGGLNTMQRTDATYIPYGVNYSGPGTAFAGTTGSYGLGRGTSNDHTLSVGTAIPLFRQRVTLALGGNVYSTSTNDFTVSTDQLAPGVSVPTSFLSCSARTVDTLVCINSPTSQSTTGQSTYGWYVEPRLNFASRFFVSPGFRMDGGSGGTRTTGGLGGLSAFPKIDLSYIAVDQSHPRGMLTLLRPRLAFGFAGTQPDPAAKLRLFSDTVTQLDASTVLPDILLSSLGNTQLRPETSRELEGGFDAELWHGRFSMTWTEYNKTRYNAIIALPIAPSVVGPIAPQQVNVGEVRNTGTEATFMVEMIQSRALSWTVGANLSNDRNLVVKLAPGFLPNERLGIVAGYPLFSDWARPIVAFADLNHNGIIDPNEVQTGDSLGYVGQAEPKYQFNFNTGLTLLNGRLSINATFAYQNGMTQNNVAAVSSGAVNFIANAPGSSLATQAAIVAANCVSSAGDVVQGCNNGTDIGFYQTVNMFRFNDLSVNYNLPTTLSRWFRVPRASIALQGNNLALHTNYRGLDPNVNAFSTVSGGDETADLGQIPEPRTWWLKLSLGN